MTSTAGRRRQLQAHVRLCTDQRCSDLTLARCMSAAAPLLNKELSPDGRMDRRSELTRVHRPRAPRCLHGWKSALRNDLYGTDVGNWQELFARGVHNNSLVLLSCAA